MKKAKVISLSMILLFFVLSTVASASELWPGWFKKNTHASSTNHSVTSGPTNGTTYSVAEPAAIMLLGAGLVSLALYARRKRAKKQ